ncbi:MAG: pantoate--beta-alanine ligase [Solirubrobacteraceae bacterium]
MRTVRTVFELRAELAAHRRAGRSIGLVPTMGAFHEGHLSLMRAARAAHDVVVVSLFVNPAQFNDADDLAVYPRDEKRDATLAAALGVSYLFAPGVSDVYPPGFCTAIAVGGVTKVLEGAVRGREHFDGVTTVVTKLLNIVAPHAAYFGQKDAQQVAVIRRLVRDLDIPVAIEVCPTVRERDGLALSSRNQLLSPTERTRATSLHRALRAVERAVAAGERDPEAAVAAGRTVLAAGGVQSDYLTLVCADTMDPVAWIDGDVLAVVAGRLGSVRLIDNLAISAGVGEPAPDRGAGRHEVSGTR